VTGPAASGRWAWVAGGAAAGAVAAGVLLPVAADALDGRRALRLERLADDPLLPGARSATDRLCGPALPCAEALQADTARLYRFADRDDAVAATRALAGEAYRSGWIVVHFTPAGALTPEQRAELALLLDCLHVGRAEDGYEC
jgi:hypothetical protein